MEGYPYSMHSFETHRRVVDNLHNKYTNERYFNKKLLQECSEHKKLIGELKQKNTRLTDRLEQIQRESERLENSLKKEKKAYAELKKNYKSKCGEPVFLQTPDIDFNDNINGLNLKTADAKIVECILQLKKENEDLVNRLLESNKNILRLDFEQTVQYVHMDFERKKNDLENKHEESRSKLQQEHLEIVNSIEQHYETRIERLRRRLNEEVRRGKNLSKINQMMKNKRNLNSSKLNAHAQGRAAGSSTRLSQQELNEISSASSPSNSSQGHYNKTIPKMERACSIEGKAEYLGVIKIERELNSEDEGVIVYDEDVHSQ